MLGKIRILILVYEYITELHGILLTDTRMVSEKDIGVHQQVIEIHSIALSATLPILFVNLMGGRHLGIPICFENFGIRRICIRHHQMILSIADAALNTSRLVRLVVELHFLDDALDQALRIRCIVNGKVGRKTDGLCLDAKNA